jgi:hypothetical protein
MCNEEIRVNGIFITLDIYLLLVLEMFKILCSGYFEIINGCQSYSAVEQMTLLLLYPLNTSLHLPLSHTLFRF